MFHVRFAVFCGKRDMGDAVDKIEVDPWSVAAIEQNRAWLTAYLLGMVGSPGVVDDLVQEVFQIAFAKRGSFEAGRSFGAWLRGIARNVALRHLEQIGREPILLSAAGLDAFDLAAAKAGALDLVPDAQERRLAFLRECMEKLSQMARQLIVRRYTQNESAATVAMQLGMSVSAVNVAVFRARAALAECITLKEIGS
jgi:RNA polymerase sigma factor (sigma-70 family)